MYLVLISARCNFDWHYISLLLYRYTILFPSLLLLSLFGLVFSCLTDSIILTNTQWLYDCKRYTFCLSPGPLVSIRCCAQHAGGLTALTTGRPAEATFTGEACVVHSTLSFRSLWSLLSSDTTGCPNLLMCMCALWNVASLLLCVCAMYEIACLK